MEVPTPTMHFLKTVVAILGLLHLHTYFRTNLSIPIKKKKSAEILTGIALTLDQLGKN